jgi:hypothetical protein
MTSAIPISAPRLAASQANGALSQGPVTEAGKLISSRNAAKHNFFTRSASLNPEQQAAFAALSEEVLAELQPQGALETQQAREYTECQWRLDHIAACLEQLQLTTTSEDCVREVQNLGPTFALYALYERRTQTTQAKALANLKQLQKDRQAEEARRQAEEQAKLDEAIKLEKLAQWEKSAWDPADFGFVFSREFVANELRLCERRAKSALAFKNAVPGAEAAKKSR